MTKTPDRPGIDHLTSDKLDALYAELDRARSRVELLEHREVRHRARFERAEAERDAIARAIHRYDNQHALCGNDVPSEHHYGEADAVLAVLAAPAVGQPAEAHGTDTSTWWTIQAQKPTGSWFDLSAGFSSVEEARAWRDTEVTEPRNWPLRIIRVDQTETVAVEDER